MPALKALVVDDEVFFRAMLATAMKSDPDFAPPAMASEGAMALQCIATEMPDVVSLDVEMPVMDGLATITELRRRYPGVPVVVLSAFDRPGLREMELLAAGADDCVTKVPHGGKMTSSLGWMRQEILPRLKRVVQARRAGAAAAAGAPSPRRAPTGSKARRAVAVVAIATSTGGPRAVEAVLAALPADFPVPIVVVQHMPAEFTPLFAARLDAKTPFRVQEGVAGAQLARGGAWIAPGGRHMTVQRDGRRFVVGINADPPENACRPAADQLFRSVAATYGGSALAVVMTGMGVDGMRGCQRLAEAGAQIIVQDEASSVVWGMPGAVVGAGLADAVVPLDRLAAEIEARVRRAADGADAGAPGEGCEMPATPVSPAS